MKPFTYLSIPYAPYFYLRHAQPEQTWGRLLPRLRKLFKGVIPSLHFAEACLGKLVLERGPHANEADLLSIIRWDLGGNEGVEVVSREVRFGSFLGGIYIRTYLPLSTDRPPCVNPHTNSCSSSSSRRC
jgi:hypothetical protein